MRYHVTTSVCLSVCLSVSLISFYSFSQATYHILTTWKRARNPCGELSKLILEFIHRMPALSLQLDLFGTTEASYISRVSLWTHLENIPPKSWTPTMLNISQNTKHTSITFTIAGTACTRELTTIWERKAVELVNLLKKYHRACSVVPSCPRSGRWLWAVAKLGETEMRWDSRFRLYLPGRSETMKKIVLCNSNEKKERKKERK